ncbi:MAG: hypothetical protein PUD31_03815 [Solobacterium sp.]|nr:hypothetical protein [Solobacterium sp.]
MQRLLSTLGVIIILFISIYNKSFGKIPSNIHYILFIVGAVMIVVGNFNKR